jgi:hypothetical protein
VNDLTSLLGNLPAAVVNVVRQVAAGNHADVPDAEAHAAYNHVAGQLTSDEFQQAAANAYEQMTPEQRAQVADYMRSQAGQPGVDVPSIPPASVAANDPGALADATAQVHAQGPNILQQLFAPGGTFSSPIAKMALLGITAFAAQRISGRR